MKKLTNGTDLLYSSVLTLRKSGFHRLSIHLDFKLVRLLFTHAAHEIINLIEKSRVVRLLGGGLPSELTERLLDTLYHLGQRVGAGPLQGASRYLHGPGGRRRGVGVVDRAGLGGQLGLEGGVERAAVRLRRAGRGRRRPPGE